MPTYKQWGFTDVLNSVAVLGTGAGAWQMTGAPGAVIEIDFGYRVGMKKISFVISQGIMGNYVLVGSNTPATGTSDAYVEANGDVRVSPLNDVIVTEITPDLGGGGLTVSYSRSPPFDTSQLFGTNKYRYYRLILVGPVTPSVYQQLPSGLPL